MAKTEHLSATVIWSPDWEEYNVYLFRDGIADTGATYYTSDYADAYATADKMEQGS